MHVFEARLRIRTPDVVHRDTTSQNLFAVSTTANIDTLDAKHRIRIRKVPRWRQAETAMGP